jgi:putative ABC transport system permease protein
VLRWIIKSLWFERLTVLSSVLGVASALLLVIFFGAVFRGESEQIVAYIRNVRADVWVMQKGVSNMHMATSFIWDWKQNKVKALPGVKRVTAINYLNTVIRTGKHKAFSFVVGLNSDATAAGPWSMAAGKAMPGEGETIIPQVLARLFGVGIGDSVHITDKRFKVVGLSKGTYSMANTVVFIAATDLDDILSLTGSVSYLLVEVKPGVDPQALAREIEREVPKVNAIIKEQFIKNDYQVAMQMGAEIIAVMTWISSGLAFLIVAFTAYTYTSRKRRELAIAKAIGFGNRAIYVGVLLQSLLITSLALLLASLIGYFLLPTIPKLLPQISLAVTMGDLWRPAIAALLVSAMASFIPAYLVARIDPLTAFEV